MDIERKEFMKRLNVIADNLKMPVFVIDNPISGVLEAYIDIIDYKPPNPNINDFVDMQGKDITDYLHSKWNSINVDQKFDVVRAGQTFDLILHTHINFSSKWSKWMWIQRK